MATATPRGEQRRQKESRREGNMFSGIRFVLAGFHLPAEIQFVSALEEHGGVNVGQYDASCTHVIVSQLLYDDPVCAAARKDSKVLVTDLWVADCLDLGALLDANSVLYRPLFEPGGISGVKSLVICLTGYQGQARQDVMRMVEMMGAQFTKPLIAATVTHLICYKFEGDKYRLAKQLGVKLVNHLWLEDCLKEWALLPEDNYSKSGWDLELSQAKVIDSEDANDIKRMLDPGIVTDQSFSCLGHPKGFENLSVPASTQVTHSPYDNHFVEEMGSGSRLKEVMNDSNFENGARSIVQNSKINDNVLLNLNNKIEQCINQIGKISKDHMEERTKDSNFADLNGIYSITDEHYQNEQFQQETVRKSVSFKKQICCAESMAEGQLVSNIGDCSIDDREMVVSTPVKKQVNGSVIEEECEGGKFGGASVHKLNSTGKYGGGNSKQNDLNKSASIAHSDIDHGIRSRGSTGRKKICSRKTKKVTHEPVINQPHGFTPGVDLGSKIQEMLSVNNTKTSKRRQKNTEKKCGVLCCDASGMKNTKDEVHIINNRHELDWDVTLNKTVHIEKKVGEVHSNYLVNCYDSNGGHNKKKNIFQKNDQKGKFHCLKQLHSDLSARHQCVGTRSEGNIKTKDPGDGNALVDHECFSPLKEIELKMQCHNAGNRNSGKMKLISNAGATMQKRKKILQNANWTELTNQACQNVAEASCSSKEVADANTQLEFDSETLKSEEIGKTGTNTAAMIQHCKTASASRKRKNKLDSLDFTSMHKSSFFTKEKCIIADRKGALNSSNLLHKDNEVTKLASNSMSQKIEQLSIMQSKAKNMVFALSGYRDEHRSFQGIIKKLGGRICRDSHHWCHQTTHLIVSDAVRRTEKFFAAAAAGRWILKADYLEASLKEGSFLYEEPFELQGPGINANASISLEAARKWRILFNTTGCGAFHGLRVVVYGTCRMPPLDTVKRAIKAGGGNVLATGPPYTRCLSSGIDFAVVNSEISQEDKWVQEFLKQRVACVTKDYFVDFICKPSAPLCMHILYDTDLAVSEALERLKNNIKVSSEKYTKIGHESFTNASSEAVNSVDEIACCKCGKMNREDVMILCGDGKGNGCGIALHIEFCNPHLKEVPADDWFCGDCTKLCTLRKKRRKK